SKYKLKVLILEKNSDVCSEVSKANSAIFHSGYNNKPNTIKAKYYNRSHEIIDQICSDLDIEYKKTGSLLVSLDDAGRDSIYEKYENGVKNKVPGIKILEKKEILDLEPNISDKVTLALYAPTTGIINPFEMTVAACENAIENGAELKLNCEVIDISKNNQNQDLFEIKCKDNNKYLSKILINCAGLYTDKINNMISNDKFFEVAPKKGQYIVLDKLEGEIVNNVIVVTKDKEDKKKRGVIVSPTTSGNILLGHSAEYTK
ncbi:NAD(P)/FAD-dependent oxidoreductase, partial [Intestinibacter sp.]|uniref:NAD(P)/FAD-dependent oxidoreductase n=1 Tax=Intestinibacter sp. TaxID=1965304 RepID=UPI002F406AF2